VEQERSGLEHQLESGTNWGRLRGVVVRIGRDVGESVVPAVGVVRSNRCYRSARPSPSALMRLVTERCPNDRDYG
jgi:hypothetical protein